MKWCIIEKIEHFIELPDSIGTDVRAAKPEILRAFYNNKYKEFDKKKSKITIKKFTDPNDLKLEISLEDGKLIELRPLRGKISALLRKYSSPQKDNDFLDWTREFWFPIGCWTPLLYIRLAENAEKFGVKLFFDEDAKKLADEFDAKVLSYRSKLAKRRWSQKSLRLKKEEM